MKLHIKEDYEDDIEIINDELSLIPAIEDDLDLIIDAELYTTSAAYNTEELPQEVVDETIQDSKDSLEHTRIITYDNEAIGILQAHELEGYWYIGEIYLIEEYRGQGIGREVLEHEINNHKDMTICLNVYKNNTHAIELYKSLGFEITEDSDGRYIMKLFPETNESYKPLKLRIKESYETTGIFYKNVDICDLPSILSKGILSLNQSNNDNWNNGKRVDNSRDVVYLFRPTGYENSFVQYGVALLEVEVNGKENEMVDNDVNKGKYIEYVCDCVPPENIKAVYIPKIFKDKISYHNSKIKWVDMEAKIYSSELYNANVNKYGKKDSFGFVNFPNDFDEINNYTDASDVLNLFAQTAEIEDSSAYNYFRGTLPNGEVIDLKYIHYDI